MSKELKIFFCVPLHYYACPRTELGQLTPEEQSLMWATFYKFKKGIGIEEDKICTGPGFEMTIFRQNKMTYRIRFTKLPNDDE